jgi:hypothetical protein
MEKSNNYIGQWITTSNPFLLLKKLYANYLSIKQLRYIAS